MKMSRLVLALESSCDETAAAVVDDDGRVLSNLIASQLAIHSPYGGVVPEVAARAHLECIDTLVQQAIEQAGVSLNQIDLIASTAGPGLIGGVLVGVMYGRGLALSLDKPWYGINHLEGHALTARLTDKVEFPYLLLLVSGGHTQLVRVEGVGRYRRIGTTLDDAAGECFDKSAKILGLGHPGGPAIEKAAMAGNGKRFALPQPMLGHAGCDFSFSGLKTAVRQKAAGLPQPLSSNDVRDLAAGVQSSIARSLRDRTARALSQPGEKVTALVVAGGVAANCAIRSELQALAAEHDIPFIAPPIALCGDNAAMIGWAAMERLISGLGAEDDGYARPRWPLDPMQTGKKTV